MFPSFGLQSEAKDLGVETNLVIKIDATAGQGIASRRGAEKLRLIETPHLWIEDCVQQGRFALSKVDSEDNLVDAGAKLLPAEVLQRHV